jgi:esterase
MKLFYRRYGEGPPFIILHGLYGSSDNWVNIGKSLAENFEVFLIDQRNHGNSPHSAEHNYTLLKNDVFEFMETQAIAKAVIMGHSMGGKVAMNFAVDYPDRVQALLIIDIAPKSYKSLLSPSPQALEHMNLINAMMEVDFSVVNKRTDLDKQLMAGIPSARIRNFLLKNVKRDRNGLYSWKLNVKTLRNELPAIMDELDPEKFKKGKGVSGFPVLFVKGEKSNYISPEDMTGIRAVFPAAEITTIPDAGHWLHAEHPDLLVKTIKYFVLGI